ncbi:MAG: DUF1835 domain-containing protein [Bacteroidota bacterium]
MSGILHILNGDGTAGGFHQSSLKKHDTLIWREMLCEGPVNELSTEKEFWDRRATFLAEKGPESSSDIFLDKVLSEVNKLKHLKKYEEVVLWFEFDLFCQVNLIFILSKLHQSGVIESTRISLICPKDHPEIENFRGLGQLSPAQLEALFPSRIQLTQQDLEIGNRAWDAYSAKDPELLIGLAIEDFGQLDCLHDALQLHFQRFPALESGLSLPERVILESLMTNHMSLKELLYAFWAKLPGYGFGDIQIIEIINHLVPQYVTKREKYVININGLNTLAGKLNLRKSGKGKIYIGGYSLNSNSVFRFDEEKLSLVRVD